MRTVSVYRLKDGILVGQTLESSNAAAVETMTPAGCGIVEGVHDHLSKRVDLVTGTVVDYQPPAPDAEHEWNVERRRWLLKPEAAAKERALARIAELESGQNRALREAALGLGTERLKAIDDEISDLRARLAE